MKLCYVLWRKFMPNAQARNEADIALNECCFDLIYRRAYPLAEALLRFAARGVKGKHVNRTLNMMVINLANAIRLQDRPEEARTILGGEDWSNVDDTLKIGVAAVKGDIGEMVALMKKIGREGHPNAEQYRTWPVFRGRRTNEAVAAAFQEIFGEPMIVGRASSITTQQQGHPDGDEPGGALPTVH